MRAVHGLNLAYHNVMVGAFGSEPIKWEPFGVQPDYFSNIATVVFSNRQNVLFIFPCYRLTLENSNNNVITFVFPIRLILVRMVLYVKNFGFALFEPTKPYGINLLFLFGLLDSRYHYYPDNKNRHNLLKRFSRLLPIILERFRHLNDRSLSKTYIFNLFLKVLTIFRTCTASDNKLFKWQEFWVSHFQKFE
jgi:hypothetical protein